MSGQVIASRSFRLMTYNVRSGHGTGVDSLIRGCAPDIVCVQEAPKILRWRSRRARLARESGLVVVTSGHASGAMILGNLRTRVVYETSASLTRYRGTYHRAVSLAVLDVAGAGRVTVVSTHLDLEEPARAAHAAEVLEHLDRARERYPAPAVLAGDINEEAGGPAWEVLTARLRDAYAQSPRGTGATFPAHTPRRRIDAVFVDPALKVAACGVPEVDPAAWQRASDHRAVVADLSCGP